MTPNPKILVIIPALNEGKHVRRVVESVKSTVPQAKILVVDDGSKDDTRLQAEQSGAQVVSAPYNLGIGGAVQIGFKIAEIEQADIAVQLDGDGQHDPLFIKDLVAPLVSGQLDLCIGSRFLSEASAFKSTPLRRAGIAFFGRLLKLVTGLPITDATSGFRAWNRQMITLFAESYPIDFPEPETIQIAKRHGARIGEVPVKMRKRLGGRSSIRYLTTLYYMIKVTLAILIDGLRANPHRRNKT